MSFEAFVSGLFYFPAIAFCDHHIYPLSPLLSVAADLNIIMSNCDREIQILGEEYSISPSDRDFVLRLLQNPELLQGFSSTETLHRLASGFSLHQNEEASHSLDTRSSQRYVDIFSASSDHSLLIILLGALLRASSYPSLDRETTGLVRLLHQSRNPHRMP